MTPRHTPGSWHVDHKCDHRIVAGNRFVADTCPNGYDCGNPDAEDLANAQLIGAVTELLEACQESLVLLKAIEDSETALNALCDENCFGAPFEETLGDHVLVLHKALIRAIGQDADYA